MVGSNVASPAFLALLSPLLLYAGFLALLTIPLIQTHAIYLHGVALTWFQDLNDPTQWGFLPGQVTPFNLRTPDGETLHAWHILPLALYQKHQASITKEPVGFATDYQERTAFKLLRDDPNSLLILYFHGAGGTLGSGWRPPSYRAMHAAAPDRIHTVAIDYRGFGRSTGTPTEDGLQIDARALAKWAMHEARIPPERIVLFAQSLGTAVATSLAHSLASRDPDPVFFRGMVIVAPFASVEELTRTYRIAGTIPLLSPIARFPALYAFFQSFLISKWPSKDRLAQFIKQIEDRQSGKYDLTIIHAKDDWDIPSSHSDTVFWHIVEATTESGNDFAEVKKKLESEKQPLGVGGWALERPMPRGIVRQEIVEFGLHDRIMSYPVVSLAILRAFSST